MNDLRFRGVGRVILILGVFYAAPLQAGEVAFLYALDADLAALRGDALTDVREVHGTVVQSFQVGGHRVSAARMGVGNIETALNAARVIGFRKPDLLVAAGPSGALINEVEVGSIHLVVRVVGYQRGKYSESGWALAPESEAGCQMADLEIIQHLPKAELAAGDAFVASQAAREHIHKITGAALVDMNSYGLSLVCRRTNTPLVILKITSDLAHRGAEEQFKSFIASYDGKLGRLVRDFIKQIPISQESPEAHENIQRLLAPDTKE